MVRARAAARVHQGDCECLARCALEARGLGAVSINVRITAVRKLAKQERTIGLPKPTSATLFEVVADGKVYRVKGAALQKWIVERRQKWSGPKGYMLSKRAMLE